MSNRSSKSTKSSSKKSPTLNKRQKLGIASAVLVLLTFTVREMLKEWAKDAADSAEAAENIYRTELGQSTISTQILQVQQELNNARLDDLKAAGTEDFTAVVNKDLQLLQQVSSDLNANVDRVSRLLEKVPFYGADDLRKALEGYKPTIEKFNKETVVPTLKPSPKNDVARVIIVKIVLVSTLFEELPVIVIGDRALTRVRWTAEIAERIYQISRWVGYGLFILGVVLGLYALFSGTNIDLEGAE
jgi:hypothetical protein